MAILSTPRRHLCVSTYIALLLFTTNNNIYPNNIHPCFLPSLRSQGTLVLRGVHFRGEGLPAVRTPIPTHCTTARPRLATTTTTTVVSRGNTAVVRKEVGVGVGVGRTRGKTCGRLIGQTGPNHTSNGRRPGMR